MGQNDIRNGQIDNMYINMTLYMMIDHVYDVAVVWKGELEQITGRKDE